MSLDWGGDCKWNLSPRRKSTCLSYMASESTAIQPFLTHCGLLTPYGDRDLSQHWLRESLVAWRHQAITWTNVDLSSGRSSDINLRASLQEIHQPSITEIIWKIKYLEFHSNFPGVNELNIPVTAAGVCWSTYCKPSFKRDLVCKFDIIKIFYHFWLLFMHIYTYDLLISLEICMPYSYSRYFQLSKNILYHDVYNTRMAET